MPSSVYPSSSLLAANAHLAQLRSAVRQQRDDSVLLTAEKMKAAAGPLETTDQSGSLPPHLGWESAAVTHALRGHFPAHKPDDTLSFPSAPTPTVSLPLKAAPIPTTLNIYPTLAAAMLREHMTAAGRGWLLLRMLDASGQGWVSFEKAQQTLTSKETACRICGKRHFRRLLQQGQGIFWERDKDTIWLKSLAKVAIQLNVSQFQGYRVVLSLSQITGSLREFKAHLYSAVHGGRQRERQRKPLSRATITTMTGLAPRTQQSFEVQARVRVQANQAIGERWTEEGWQEACWQRGRAAFEFVDYLGKMGAVGQRYIAWQLPNNYSSPLKPGGRGRKRQLNKQIADLRMKRGAGNGNRQQRRYFSSGKGMAGALKQGAGERGYWLGAEGLWFSRQK